MNMPFSRPGAVDLSALKQAPTAPAAGSGGGAASGAYALDVDEQSFQSVLESSMTAPVVLVVHSPSRMPASTQMAADLSALAEELAGRILVGRVDVDSQAAIAQAMQVQSVPFVAMVLQGRLAPLLQDVASLEDLRSILTQILDQVGAQGMTGRHQPLGGSEAEEQDEPSPRYAAAEEALMGGDLDGAVAAYQKLLDENPADGEASLGLARARLMQRTAGADLSAARASAADRPDDVDAQTLVADLDLLGGHVDDAFARLLGLLRRTQGEERDRVRVHLIGLFDVVGNEDPRVQRARRDLASALF